jgi:hypothetical protein
MADATAVSGGAGPPPSSSAWLWGPKVDLLFGAGVLYFFVFGAYALAGSSIRGAQPAYLLPLLVLLVSMPHYGGTLLRVYESRRERRAYALFSLWATLAISVLFVFGVYSLAVGSVLVTIYLTWSPWHYTGQNYGIATMFLRRRGVALDPITKRWLYASFILSYALVFLVFHASNENAGAISFDRFAYERATVAFLPLGIASQIALPIASVAVFAYLSAAAVTVFRLLKRGSLSAVTPALLLMVSQALWFSLPFGIRFFDLQTGIEPIDAQVRIKDYVLWVALAHAVQYLWVTSYYAKASPEWSGQPAYWSKVLLSGIAIWTLPVILFAPDRLGTLAYEGGLSLILAATINIHHFVLDGAIWKLRHMRIGNVLIQSQADTDGDLVPTANAGRNWIRPTVWGVCVATTAAAFAGFLWMDVQLNPARRQKQLERVDVLLERAAWLGRDSPKYRRELGRRYFAAGEPELALASYRRSLELKPDSKHWGEFGFIYQEQGDFDAAIEAYSSGLAISPDHPVLLKFLASSQLEVGLAPDAILNLEHLLELTPNDESALNMIALARKVVAEP